MFRLPIALAAAIVLSGAPASALEPAPLKMPPVGTKIHYDEGGTPVVFEVIESKPGAYAARRTDGQSSFATVGGLVSPALRYRDPRGYDGTQRLVEGDPTAIYPLAVGKSVSFKVAGEAPSRGWKWTNSVNCAVTGTEKVKVALGEFDTFVVRCERSGTRGKEQTVTRYYAPSLGLSVRSVTVDHVNNNRWNTDIVKLEAP